MGSRRREIALTSEELAQLLEEGRTVVLGSHTTRGGIHLVALWYVVVEGAVWVWTYARSQKVRNLSRDPRASMLVESGEAYGELRGALLSGRARIVDDPDWVRAIGDALIDRYELGSASAREAMRASAAKRVAVTLDVEHVASWDHRKLGGRY